MRNRKKVFEQASRRKKRRVDSFIIRVLAIAVLVIFGFPELNIAQSLAVEMAVGPVVGKSVSEAQVLAKDGNFSEARKKIYETKKIPGKSAYESFVIYDYETYLNVKLKDYVAAARAAEAALATGMVAKSVRSQRLSTLAKLNFSIKNYSKTVDFAQKYRLEGGADEDVLRLEMQAYYLQKKYAAAQKSAEEIVLTSSSRHDKPDETVLQIWSSAAYHQKDNSGQFDALTALVSNYPKPVYWKDLVNLVATDVGRSDRMSLEVLRLKLAMGLLETPDDYIEMAQLAIQLGLPGEALDVISSGQKAGLMDGRNKSRELRLKTMAEDQARRDQASLDSRGATAAANAALGEAYASYGKTEKAIRLYNVALGSPNADADMTRLHLGQAYFSKGDLVNARKAFLSIKTAKLNWLTQLWVLVTNNSKERTQQSTF